MKKYGIFSGWFTPSGKRGRISFLFSLIFVYLICSLIIYISIILSIPTALILVFSGNQTLINSSRLFIFVPVALIFLLIFWSMTCIEIQRLRDIGFNSLTIAITILIIFSLQILSILSEPNIYKIEELNNFHWTDFVLIFIGLFFLFMPSTSNDYKKKPLDKMVKEIHNNTKLKKIDPKL